MGWDCEFHALHHKPDGRVDRRACLDEILTWTTKNESGNVVKTARPVQSSMIGTVYYAAVRFDYADGRPPQVWGAVALTCGRGRDGTEWGYKLMDETEGPGQDDCPASILRLLTPTNDEWSNGWRKRCADKLAARGITVSPDTTGEQLTLAI